MRIRAGSRLAIPSRNTSSRNGGEADCDAVAGLRTGLVLAYEARAGIFATPSTASISRTRWAGPHEPEAFDPGTFTNIEHDRGYRRREARPMVMPT